MEIDSGNFKKILTLSLDEQIDFLAQLGFDLMGQCDEYNGKIIDKLDWLTPDVENLRRYFEKTLDDSDERMRKFEKNTTLSDEEREGYKEYLISEAIENEYYPGLFTGILTCGNDRLFVVAERTGGAWDCEARFVGIYENLEQAIREIGGPTGQSIDI